MKPTTIAIKIMLTEAELAALPPAATNANRVRLALGLAAAQWGGARMAPDWNAGSLGLALQRAQRRAQFTRAQLGAHFGVHPHTISGWIGGTQRPSAENRRRIEEFIAAHPKQ